MIPKIRYRNYLMVMMLCSIIVLFSSCKDEPPICEISTPQYDEVILYGTTYAITVDADDQDGSLFTKAEIANVEFLIDQISVGTVVLTPYVYEWNTSYESLGSHTITAIAHDDGDNSTSSEVSVILNDAPTCSITTPSGSTVYIGGDVTLQASASDELGGIDLVSFYVNSSLVGTDSYSTYECTWNTSNYSEGYCTITVEATDMYGETTSSYKTVELKKIKILGVWEGTYSGYDDNTSSDVTIQRRLRINTDRTYSDTLWGKPSGQSEYVVYELELGEFEINSSQTEVSWEPYLSKKVDFSTTGNLEEVTSEGHVSLIELSNGDTDWAFYDESLGVSYYLQRR